MEDKAAKSKRPFRTIRLIINSILLLFSIIIVVQNDKTVEVDFLWTQFNVSLAMLVILTGSIGSLITFFILLFRK